MRFSRWITLGILLTTPILSNAQTYEDNVISPLFFNFNGNLFWASGGAGIADQNNESAAIHNPASVNTEQISITVEGGYKFKSDLSGITCNDISIIPSCVALATPIDRLTLLGGYTLTYRNHEYLGNITMTTNEIMSGDYYADVTVHTVYAGVKMQVLEQLSLAAMVVDNIAKEDVTIFNQSIHYSGNKIGFIAGLQFMPIERLNIGASVQTESRILLLDEHLSSSAISYRVIAGMPLRAEMGAAINISDAFKLFGSMEYQKWSSMYGQTFSATEEAEDKWQIHAGGAIAPSSDFELRFGFFTENYMDTNSDARDFYNQKFLTAGVSANITDNIAFTITYITSQPLQKNISSDSKSFSQDILSAGLRVIL
jgi:hypothetical protein